MGIDAALVEEFDIDDNDVLVTGSQWKFPDINEVEWAQAARLATDICRDRRFNEPFERFAGGFFTGHQDGHKRQIAALLIAPVDSPRVEIVPFDPGATRRITRSWRSNRLR